MEKVLQGGDYRQRRRKRVVMVSKGVARTLR
jgi:hypothetical protein